MLIIKKTAEAAQRPSESLRPGHSVSGPGLFGGLLGDNTYNKTPNIDDAWPRLMTDLTPPRESPLPDMFLSR